MERWLEPCKECIAAAPDPNQRCGCENGYRPYPGPDLIAEIGRDSEVEECDRWGEEEEGAAA